MAARNQDQNLDSLLDTMSNVVGILVVLVAVMQLSVGEAVERIAAEQGQGESITAEDLARVSTQAEAVEAAVVMAEGELQAFDAEARRNGRLLEELQPHLDLVEGLAGRLEAEQLSIAALDRQTLRSRGEMQALEVDISERQRRIEGLEALVGTVPSETRPKVARLPNPRIPPAGAKEVAVLCRYGRCALLDLEGMRVMLNQGLENALGKTGNWEPADLPWAINLFNKQSMGSGNYYWDFREDDRAFFADIKWSDKGHGENWEELSAVDSDFMGGLSGFDRRGRFLRFYVWSDSFEVYLEARYLAEQRGWDIGWLPIDESEEVGFRLLGGARRKVFLD